MRVPRVHCPLQEGELTVTGEEAHHLARVLRLGPGDRFAAFDGSGAEVTAEVLEAGTFVRARVLERRTPDVEAPVAVHLFLAMVKGERFDWAVEKATELGVAGIVPLLAERAEVRDPGESRRQRWRRLARSAAAQSGRVRVPEVEAPAPFARALQPPGWILVPGGPPLEGPWPSSLSLLVGPEGGFTEAEVEAAVRAGLRPAGLGPRILRVETAALAALARILAEPAGAAGAGR